MPHAAKRPCTYPGCRGFTVSRGRCADHATQANRDDAGRRGTSAQRGYDYRWQQAREFYLRSNPLCIICDATGLITPATVVDHVQPHKGDMTLFWDESNWQPLCASCHSAKTASKDMGAWSPKK